MSLYDQRESLKKLLGDANLYPYISPYSLVFYCISIFPLFGVCQECLRCYVIYTPIYTSTTRVSSLSIVSIGVIYTLIVIYTSVSYTLSTSVTTVTYTSVTSIVIVVIPSSGAFVENPYAFWENTALFAFWRKVRIFLEYAANAIDPPLRASTSHGLLR